MEKKIFKQLPDSTAKLLDREERLAKTPVTKIMIPLDMAIGVERLEDIDDAKTLEVKYLIGGNRPNRIPIVSNMDKPLLIIHKSILYEYLAEDDGRRDHELKDIHDNSPNLWQKITSFGVVGVDASAADANLAMRNVGPDCADIFITKDGTKNTETIGWITNVDLLKAEHI